jgi:hypothetical protein
MRSCVRFALAIDPSQENRRRHPTSRPRNPSARSSFGTAISLRARALAVAGIQRRLRLREHGAERVVLVSRGGVCTAVHGGDIR